MSGSRAQHTAWVGSCTSCVHAGSGSSCCSACHKLDRFVPVHFEIGAHPCHLAARGSADISDCYAATAPRCAQDAGLKVDQIAPRLSFFFAAGLVPVRCEVAANSCQLDTHGSAAVTVVLLRSSGVLRTLV